MQQTFKEFLVEQQTVNPQHAQYKNEVMRILGVTALSPADRNIVHNGMAEGLPPEEVAYQLQQPALEPKADLPSELDQDPEGMQTGGGMGITGA